MPAREHCPACEHVLLWADGQLVCPRRSCSQNDVDPAATGPKSTDRDSSRVREEVAEA
jgi:uncharacterized Zn finger protein (UPF0148 family)